MRAEILHIAECPGWRAAGEELRAVLDATGHGGVGVEFVLVASAEDAARLPFAGSPTILIDGEDLFASAGRSAELACRVYMTPDGLRAWPTRSQIEEALQSRR